MKTIELNGRKYRCTRYPESENDFGGWEFKYKGTWRKVINYTIRHNLNKYIMKNLTIYAMLLVTLFAACKNEPKIISVSPERFDLTYDAQSGSFTVESNTDWNYNTDNSDWILLERSGSTVNYSVLWNTGAEQRIGTAEISAPDAGTKTVMFVQEEFPLYKTWIRYGDMYWQSFAFSVGGSGTYKFFNTETQVLEDNRNFVYEFDEEKINMTFLDNYEHFIFFYAFSDDRTTLTLTDSYGEETVYGL